MFNYAIFIDQPLNISPKAELYYGKTNLLKSSCSKIIFNMIKQNNRLKSIPECFEDIIYLEKL